MGSGAITLLFVFVAIFGSCRAFASDVVPSFPGAEGFGALASGGRGGENYCVTNLDDSGPGTFREAVSQSHRTITFCVGGVVHLKSNLAVSSDVTILGQTAPADGITLYGHSVSFSGSSNIVVRYLRVREGIGGDRGKCSVNIVNGSDMIFDHVSIEWGRWDCLGLTHGSRNITFQYCIFGQGINPQQFGALVDSVTNITFSHNLWIDNQSRNPKAKGSIQYINNVVYNWGRNGLVGGHSQMDHQLDVIGNYFIRGPSSNDHFVGEFTSTDHVFQRDNYVDLQRDGRLNGTLISDDQFRNSGGPAIFAPRPFLHPTIPVTTDSAPQAWKTIVMTAGCSLHRDPADQALIAQLKSPGKSGRLITDESNMAFKDGHAAILLK
ncbi:MAG: pectate lyase family protein [Limisphaerales bacterium]